MKQTLLHLPSVLPSDYSHNSRAILQIGLGHKLHFTSVNITSSPLLWFLIDTTIHTRIYYGS